MTRVFHNQLGLKNTIPLEYVCNGYAPFQMFTHFNCWQLLHSSVFQRSLWVAKFILHLKSLI